MARPQLHATAFVLSRRPSGSDNFEQCTLFGAEHGLLNAMRRISRKPGAAALDLFDEAEFWLESPDEGGAWFIKEHRLVERHTGIGGSYESLNCATAVARLLLHNPAADDSRETLAGLVRSAFAALAGGARPDLVWLKSLYLFLRDEGYPVRQQWLPGLAAEDRATATGILGQPVAGQEADHAATERITRLLEAWVQGETDLRL